MGACKQLQTGALSTQLWLVLTATGALVPSLLCCIIPATAAAAAAAGKVMVLEALLKGIKASEPTDKVVLVSNYTGAQLCASCACACGCEAGHQ
jgi:hypothetical protein